jgi:copper chaperone CopZ
MVTTLYIDGMRTVHCARALFTSLARISGIGTAEVTIGKAILEHADRLDEGALAHAVADVGYTLREVVTESRRLPLHQPDEPLGGSA